MNDGDSLKQIVADFATYQAIQSEAERLRNLTSDELMRDGMQSFLELGYRRPIHSDCDTELFKSDGLMKDTFLKHASGDKTDTTAGLEQGASNMKHESCSSPDALTYVHESCSSPDALTYVHGPDEAAPTISMHHELPPSIELSGEENVHDSTSDLTSMKIVDFIFTNRFESELMYYSDPILPSYMTPCYVHKSSAQVFQPMEVKCDISEKIDDIDLADGSCVKCQFRASVVRCSPCGHIIYCVCCTTISKSLRKCHECHAYIERLAYVDPAIANPCTSDRHFVGDLSDIDLLDANLDGASSDTGGHEAAEYAPASCQICTAVDSNPICQSAFEMPICLDCTRAIITLWPHVPMVDTIVTKAESFADVLDTHLNSIILF